MCSQVCVYHKWDALCCFANTLSKPPSFPSAHPAALVLLYNYLLSSLLFPPSVSKLLEKLAEVFISHSNPYSRYTCQRDQGEEVSGGSMFGLGQPWVKLWPSSLVLYFQLPTCQITWTHSVPPQPWHFTPLCS